MSTYTQKTFMVDPSPIFSTINYMTNVTSSSSQHYTFNNSQQEEVENELFEIDDVDTPIYSSSCQSVPPLMIDNISSDDEDMFESDDRSYSNLTSNCTHQSSWNPTLVSPLLQPKTVTSSLSQSRKFPNAKRSSSTSLSFNSVLLDTPPSQRNTSVTELNYKIWLSSN